jgi:hypothetical protein
MTDEEKKRFFEISKRIGYKVGTYCNDEEIEVFEKILEDYKYKNNLIEKQQEEIEKKDKIIDEMANKLHKLALYYDDEGTYCEMKNEICDELDNLNHVEDIHKHCTSCIKEYFINKVEKEK